ncbi:MAG: APC family permease [Methyloligellaceae bacterium]
MKSKIPVRLKRSLSLAHLVLYGLGVTIGAGIYVLIKDTTAEAGIYAPVAFILSAIVMAFTAGSFAEFASRLPVSAGEAAYVRKGLNSKTLSLFVGLGVASAGIVSAATVSIGSVGYIREFIDVSPALLITMVVLIMGMVATWGIVESITLAALFTLVEVGGLLLIIGGGFYTDSTIAPRLISVFPPFTELGLWVGISSAGLLAFFAFIGFEDLVNIAEEAENPKVTMPWAIFITLFISTLLYFLVVSIAVLSVPLDKLTASDAPLTLVFEKTTSLPTSAITIIAIIATLNGVIIQMIMASRVIYGLARQGSLPAILSSVNSLTRTPLIATLVVIGAILIMALLFPLKGLAAATSVITLSVFSLVNLSLLRLKIRKIPAPKDIFTVGTWVPALGFVISLAFLGINLYNLIT